MKRRIFQEIKLALDDRGYSVVHNNSKTSVEGIFIVGDVRVSLYRQVVVLAGDSCKAIFDAKS